MGGPATRESSHDAPLPVKPKPKSTTSLGRFNPAAGGRVRDPTVGDQYRVKALEQGMPYWSECARLR